jgi:hypothetical protein
LIKTNAALERRSMGGNPAMHPRFRERGSSAPSMSSARSIAWLWAVALALCAGPSSAGEIFKCVGKNGTDLYQNFPCQFDSLGSWQDAGSPPAIGKSRNAAGPRIGMTADEVKALWGEPLEISQDEQRQGRVEVWHYGETRSVQFNRKQSVVAVQQ